MMVAENGQGKAGFYYHLDHCCQLVSEVYGRPDRAAWTNSDYVRLSHILFQKTSVQISPNTLKRIFGKIKTDSRYYPQKATRDALASYVGYTDWEQFVEAQSAPPALPEERDDTSLQLPAPPVPIVVPSAGHNRNPAVLKRSWLVAGLGILALAILTYVLTQRSTTNKTPVGQLKLICKNPVGETPHSANFLVEGMSDPADQAAPYTLEYDDGRKKQLDPAVSQYNHYYEKPGRFYATVRRGDQYSEPATVFLPTKGWMATANMMYDTTRVYPIEIPNLFTGGKHSISAAEAAHAGIDTNRTFFIEFANAKITDIDGDNFELTTQVITSPTRTGVRCSQVGITVYGESSKHSFDVIKPGCVYWTNIHLSEKHRFGQQEDLGFLGADLRAGGTVTLRVANRHAQLFINGRQVYAASYTKPLQRVYGVYLRFSGIGTVNSFSLKDLKTGKLFDGSFPVSR